MSRTSSKETQSVPTDLREQVASEARRLRSLADAVRAQATVPNLGEYVRSGRGPAYQRDHAAWMKVANAAGALDRAAFELEQTLTSSLL